MKNRVIKYQNQADLQRELTELNNLLLLHNENEFILSSLNFKSVEDMEVYVLEKTGFKNVQMAMTALGYDEDYNTILKNTESIGDKFNGNDLTGGKFTEDFIQSITDKHTTYLSDKDIKIGKTFKKMIEDFRKLELKPEEKRHLVIDNYGNLVFNPFSYLRNV